MNLQWDGGSTLAPGEATTAAVPVGVFQGFRTEAAAAFHDAFGPTANREIDRSYHELYLPSPVVDAETLTRKYGGPDLKFGGPMQEDTARDIAENYYRQQLRATQVSRSGIGGLARFSAQFVGSSADPLAIGVGGLGGIAGGRVASMFLNEGLAMRLGAGAAGGFIGTAATEPFQVPLAAREGRQYTAGDVAMDLAIGTLFGGAFEGLHYGAGKLRDRWLAGRAREEGGIGPRTPDDPMPPSTPSDLREMAMSSAINAVIDGKQVDVSRAYADAQAYNAKGLRPASQDIAAALTKLADADERPPVGAYTVSDSNNVPMTIKWGLITRNAEGDVITHGVASDAFRRMLDVTTEYYPTKVTPNETMWTVPHGDGVLELRNVAGKDGKAEQWTLRQRAQKPGEALSQKAEQPELPGNAGPANQLTALADVTPTPGARASTVAPDAEQTLVQQAETPADPVSAKASAAADESVAELPEPKGVTVYDVDYARGKGDELDALDNEIKAVDEQAKAMGLDKDEGLQTELAELDEKIAREDFLAEVRAMAAFCLKGHGGSGGGT
jgi:hypothetical protein